MCPAKLSGASGGNNPGSGISPGVKADLFLLITAVIWGFAFVAQRMGMVHMGPFTFNALRFSMGALALLPLLTWRRQRERSLPRGSFQKLIWAGLLTGLSLFGGASLQQIGLVGTSASKAGFITGLYVILVPLMGLFWRKRTHPAHWIGAALAVPGLYLLSVQADFTISSYDLVVLGGAFLWAVHVHLIARYAGQVGVLRLAVMQSAVCGVLSGFAALYFETISFTGIVDGIWPILYGAFLSVGVAYTLQVVAQRTADPTHAVIILSLESVFAVLGGWIFLRENLSSRALVGCGLMLGGMMISQIFGKQNGEKVSETRNGLA